MPDLQLIKTLAWTLARLVSGLPVTVPLVALPVAVWSYGRTWTRDGERAAARAGAAALLAMGVGDGLLLAGLPRLGLSFGPIGIVWLGLIVVRTSLAFGALALARGWQSLRPAGAMALVWGLNIAILAASVYALYVEPFDVRVSHVPISVPGTAPARLRIVHLSDLHVERTTRRERTVLELVERLQPDLVVMTGDYLNLSYVDDPTARRDARELISRLHAPYGVYAVSGSPPVDTPAAMSALFDGLPNVTVLSDEAAEMDVEGQVVHLIGVANADVARDGNVLRTLAPDGSAGAYTILLYHTPDLAEAAADAGVDLYLAGHTHGGQIRLPWYGAVLTSSLHGKRYEAGLYHLGATRLYVSRGLGTEGLGMPRVRFLCPPEIVELEVEWTR